MVALHETIKASNPGRATLASFTRWSVNPYFQNAIIPRITPCLTLRSNDQVHAVWLGLCSGAPKHLHQRSVPLFRRVPKQVRC